MPIAFHATHIHTSEEEGVTLVIFSVDENLEAERYLMFQRKQVPSPRDAQLGMDDVYIETCGQGWSWYGHIESISLSSTGISVQLDAAAAAEIGDTGRIEVSFDVSPTRFEVVRAALRRALAGRAYYKEAAA